MRKPRRGRLQLEDGRSGTVKIIGPGDIAVAPGRMRAVREDKVDDIAESIRRRGLLQPIVVRPRKGASSSPVGTGSKRCARTAATASSP
jgi:hypothetical protein